MTNGYLGTVVEPQIDRTAQPVVVEAVIPTRNAVPRTTAAAGVVVVEVKINSAGSVRSAHAVYGNRSLFDLSRDTARRWKFEPGTGKKARITFVYHIAPSGTPLEELLPIFKLPYQVEVFQSLPDRKSVAANDEP